MAGFVTHRNFKLSDTPDLSGKVAVVTGGQAGIGREITAQLLLHGVAKVYVIARSESKFEAAKTEWAEKKKLSPEDIRARVDWLKCDLSDIDDVARAALVLKSRTDRLDILINNAGLPPMSTYELSAQGIEAIFATNHVGHFVLTNLLLPLLEQTASTHGSARIVNTTSSLHLACQALNLDLLTSATPVKYPAAVDGMWRYARSKLANILFTRELAAVLERRGVENLYCNCFFPGNIPTDAMDTWKQIFGSLIGKAFKGTFQLVGQSPEEAAATAIFLAAGKTVETQDTKGKYFVPIATEHITSIPAQDMDLAEKLWSWSVRKVEETLGEGWQLPTRT